MGADLGLTPPGEPSKHDVRRVTSNAPFSLAPGFPYMIIGGQAVLGALREIGDAVGEPLADRFGSPLEENRCGG